MNVIEEKIIIAFYDCKETDLYAKGFRDAVESFALTKITDEQLQTVLDAFGNNAPEPSVIENPTHPICKDCGSDDVSADAVVVYNKLTNEWDVEGIMDEGFCCACEDTQKYFHWVPTVETTPDEQTNPT